MTHSKVDLAIKGSIAALLVALGFVVVWSMQEHIVEVGDTAPNFSITTNAGDQMTPRNFGGKVLVLNYWASWCAPCVEEIPSLNQLQRQMPQLMVVGVDLDEDPEAYHRFLARHEVDFLTIRDPQQHSNALYGTHIYPETYAIDRNGKIRRKFIIVQDWTSPEIMDYLSHL